MLNSSKHTNDPTDNKGTHAHLTETAFNHLSSTKQTLNATIITLLKRTSDSEKTSSRLDSETTLHHSVTRNTGTIPNSANTSGPSKTTTLPTLFHGVSFHLVHPTAAPAKDVIFNDVKEKLLIICRPDLPLLNKRNELPYRKNRNTNFLC